MKATLSTFKKLAHAEGIDVEYSAGSMRSVGSLGLAYHITLIAPEGKVFKTSGCGIDCSLNGEVGGHAYHSRPDWKQATAELKVILAVGFDEAVDSED